MTVQTLANIVIGLALVAWIVYRQMTWRVVSSSRLWRMPIVLGVIGVIVLAQTKDVHLLTALDVVILVVELVISAAIGALMGRIAVFRTRPAQASDARVGRDGTRRIDTHRAADGTESVLESRTGWWGLILWVALIGVRVGIDFTAVRLGAVVATTTGVILVMVAANRAARVLVLLQRVARNTLAAG